MSITFVIDVNIVSRRAGRVSMISPIILPSISPTSPALIPLINPVIFLNIPLTLSNNPSTKVPISAAESPSLKFIPSIAAFNGSNTVKNFLNDAEAKKSLNLSRTRVNSSTPLRIGARMFLGSKPNASPKVSPNTANRPSSLSKIVLINLAVSCKRFLGTCSPSRFANVPPICLKLPNRPCGLNKPWSSRFICLNGSSRLAALLWSSRIFPTSVFVSWKSARIFSINLVLASPVTASMLP